MSNEALSKKQEVVKAPSLNTSEQCLFMLKETMKKERIKDVIAKLSQIELGWVTGFIDGEGCFMIAKHKEHKYINCHYQSLLYLNSTDKRPLVWLSQQFGGKVGFRKNINPKHKDYYAWCCCGNRLTPLIQSILPYLKVKQEVAQVVYKFQERKFNYNHLSHNKQISMPQTEVEEREKLYQQVRKLNKRGKE